MENGTEKILMEELSSRIEEVENTLERDRSLIPKIKIQDFYIEIGLTVFFILWWGVGVGYNGKLGSTSVALLVSMLLIWMGKKTWDVLK